MSWSRTTAAALTAVAVGLAAVGFAATSAPAKKKTTPAMSRSAMLERGKYLVTVAGCNDCHTPGTLYGAPDFSRMLSGAEMGWRGPWGVTYARNLTPDKETGLGNWTRDQIVKAFRSGVRPDGTMLLPPMPWQDFAALTDVDAYAIAAFLQSIPAISHKVPDRIPPGPAAAAVAAVDFPPPTAWDAPRTPPEGAPGDTTKH